MVVNPGDLRERIDLERDNVIRVDGAEHRTPEIYAANLPAAVEYLSGSELWRAQQVDATVNVRVRLRWRTDVRTSHRVLYDGMRMEIVSVIPELRQRMQVTLMCVAKSAGQ